MRLDRVAHAFESPASLAARASLRRVLVGACRDKELFATTSVRPGMPEFMGKCANARPIRQHVRRVRYPEGCVRRLSFYA